MARTIFVTGITIWMSMVTISISMPVPAPFKNFGERCLDDCNASKNLQCSRGTCRCLTDYYEYGGTCYQTYDKILVRNATVLSINTTSLQVTWNLPEHATSVDRIEITTSPTNYQPLIEIRNIITTSSAVVGGLESGTEYSILLTSVDYDSFLAPVPLKKSVKVNTSTFAAFGGACSDTVICYNAINLECASDSCKCKPRHYYYSGSCNALSELQVINVEVTVLRTTSVSVSWKNPAANHAIENKIVTWTRRSTATTETKALLSNDTSTDITGLTPGDTYDISVVSVDTDSRPSTQEIQSDHVITTTKPAIPGDIVTNIPHDSGNSVHLSWISSVGLVTYYRVIFEGGNSDTRIQVTFYNAITMTSLTPGRRYNMTITAISGTTTSDPRYGTTKTTAIEINSSFDKSVVLVPVVSLAVITLVVIVVVVVVITIRRKKKKSKNAENDNGKNLQMVQIVTQGSTNMKNDNNHGMQKNPYVNKGRVTDEEEKYTSLYLDKEINRYRRVTYEEEKYMSLY